MDKQKKKISLKTIIIAVLILVLLISFGFNSSKSKKYNEEINNLEEKYNSELKEKEKKIITLEEKVKEAAPWFELSEKEQERQIKQEEEKQLAEQKAEEKKAKEKEKKKKEKEAAEKKKKEEEEKKGYDTGITYDELARTPEKYELEKVKFSGKVVQVMDGDDSVQLRIAVNDDYDKMLYVEYDSDIVDSRVLEDDQITIMGVSLGLITYQSTMGGEITIPALEIDKIEQ